ncbi:hypothetical protein Q8A67_013505 [Cirrhinus molitorella]|uniref:Uncharacterized protein n=1 Tax=Cirrhinus molitorella TaxID=172907 RepID=A0AA88TNH4_9TELE|nr:hypothetical protein Q8A67_013505 [Cirrhinus molitorella]
MVDKIFAPPRFIRSRGTGARRYYGASVFLVKKANVLNQSRGAGGPHKPPLTPRDDKACPCVLHPVAVQPSPVSSYSCVPRSVPAIEKWTVTGLRRALSNADVYFSWWMNKLEVYNLFASLQPGTPPPRSTPPLKAANTQTMAHSTPYSRPEQTSTLTSASQHHAGPLSHKLPQQREHANATSPDPLKGFPLFPTLA